jgi:preprotein translocase subunit SecA
VIDQKWKDHLYANDHIKEGVWTMGYAQKDPLVEYRFQSFQMFEDMVTAIKEDTVEFFFRAQIQGQVQEKAPDESSILEHTLRTRAIHQGVQGYGVENLASGMSAMTAGADETAAWSKTDTSKAAVQTAGGSSQRKSNRRR